MKEDEVKSYISESGFVKIKRDKTVFCKIVGCSDGIVLLKTNRTQKVKAKDIEKIEVVPPEDVEQILRELRIR